MDEAFERFVEQSPLAAAERERLQVAEGRWRQSAAWTNPTVTFSQEGYALGRPAAGFDDQEFQVGAWQEFELGGKRSKRRDAARIELDAERARYQNFLREQRLELSRFFVSAFYGAKELESLHTAFRKYQGIKETHRRGYELGEVSGLAQLKLEGEEIWYLVEIARAERESHEAWGELALRIGWEQQGPPPELRLESPESAPVVDPEPLIGLALQRRPDLAAVKLDLLAAEASVELERTRKVPNLNLGGGYKRDFGQTSFFLGVELPLPIWDRREGAIRAEVAAGRRLANLSTWQELRIRHEVARVCLLYSRLREATGRLEADFMNKLDRVVAITGLSYQQGEAGILEYLDSLRTERDAILAFNRLLKEFQLARFELEAAVGAPLSGITP